MSIILSNRVRNHIDSIVKEHLFLDDVKAEDAKLYSRGLAAICLAGLASTQYSHVKNYIIDGSATTESTAFTTIAQETNYT